MNVWVVVREKSCETHRETTRGSPARYNVAVVADEDKVSLFGGFHDVLKRTAGLATA